MEKIMRILFVSLATCLMALAIGCSSENSASSVDSTASASTATSAATDGTAPGAAASLDAANLADGTYQVEVTLEGGTGRAAIESPARVVVDGGQAKLVVVWSSDKYDLMIVDGQEYLPVPRAGNSTFEIPVANVADDLSIQAETTAMSEPHLIDYIIHIDAGSLASAA